MKQINLLKKLSIMAAVAILMNACGTGTPKKAVEVELRNINSAAQGNRFELTFEKGKAHNHPSFAVWLENMDETMIQTLFVTHSVGTGIFGHGDLGDGRWSPDSGKAIRPATLPYWLHKRVGTEVESYTLPSPEKPVTDAYTGATPRANFQMILTTDEKLSGKIRFMLEINQTWDVNEYWTSNKYPDDFGYISSRQPALVYAVTIDLENPEAEYILNPIGHSHYSGKDGKLYTDLSTFTTALDIAEKMIVKVLN
ncbi:MAG TPA: hypothetical protein ENN84_12010 [Candidatus Marinimicrobia bacterium]|nr:hypothetical protein [Candidatus Neomarinimicrobiota bacterium]